MEQRDFWHFMYGGSNRHRESHHERLNDEFDVESESDERQHHKRESHRDVEGLNRSNQRESHRDIEGLNRSNQRESHRDVEGLNRSNQRESHRDIEGLNRSNQRESHRDVEGLNRSNQRESHRDVEGLNRSTCRKLADIIGGDVITSDPVCVVQRLRDIDAKILGRRTQSPLALPFALSFENHSRNTLNLGETVILQKEINPFLTELRKRGLIVTAVHNHWLFDEPRLMYMHWENTGDPFDFARKSFEAAKEAGLF
ncbi:DUF1259 domain-containing protein [Niallia oryzisoli]|uniref:DUF1259 domain-containing protein n=1 Tax=Niallia oryzisoli TaxID=1737571 RepID=UPI003734F6BD